MKFILSNDLYAKNGILEEIHLILKDDGFNSPICMVDEGFLLSEYWKIIKKNLECLKIFQTPDNQIPLFNGNSENNLNNSSIDSSD